MLHLQCLNPLHQRRHPCSQGPRSSSNPNPCTRKKQPVCTLKASSLYVSMSRQQALSRFLASPAILVTVWANPQSEQSRQPVFNQRSTLRANQSIGTES